MIDLADFDLSDLESTLDAVWALLADGVADRRSAAHTPTFATAGLDGRPRSRVVVLRGVERAGPTIRFHTDLRSSKIRELVRDPRCSLLIYDGPAKLQVRLEGSAAPHHVGAIADAAWTSAQQSSRRCYGVKPGPGIPIPGSDDFTMPQSEDEVAAGRENFAAVIVRIERIETLWLRHEGHRRALFDWSAKERTDHVWLTP